MKLYIAKQYDREFTEDTYKLATYMLKMKSTHLFIASNYWEYVELEMDDAIPAGALKTLALTNVVPKVKLTSDVTSKTLQLLCDLYPDKSGALRKAYMTGADVKGVLAECLA